MNVKTGNNLFFNKESQLENARMKRFSDVSSAQASLTVDGMFGYVANVGVYLNINGTVTKIAPSVAGGSGYGKAYYQSTTPSGLSSTDTGTLWYNTTNASLNIWTGSAFIQIGGNTNSSLVVQAWTANATYLSRQIVEHQGDLWMNSTGNTIATTTFNSAEWKNLTESTIKIYELLRTHANGTTNGDIALNGDGKIFTITHNCQKQYPNVDLYDKATNETVFTKITYTDTNTLSVTNIENLTTLGIDLKVRIWC